MHGDELGQTTKIMIIEDDDDILLLYNDYLKKKGHTITISSTTANAAVRDYDSYKPDLVIADFKQVREEMVDTGFARKKVTILIKPVRLSRLGQIISRLSNDKQNPV